MANSKHLITVVTILLAMVLSSNTKAFGRGSASGSYMKEARAICFLAAEDRQSSKRYRVILTDFHSPEWNLTVQQSDGEPLIKASFNVTKVLEMFKKKIVVIDGEGKDNLSGAEIRINFWVGKDHIRITCDGVDSEGKSKYWPTPSHFELSENTSSTRLLVTNASPSMLPDLLSDDWKDATFKQILELFGVLYAQYSK